MVSAEAVATKFSTKFSIAWTMKASGHDGEDVACIDPQFSTKFSTCEHPGIHTSREVRAVLQLSVVLEYLLHLVAYPGVQRHMNVFRFVIDNIRTPRRWRENIAKSLNSREHCFQLLAKLFHRPFITRQLKWPSDAARHARVQLYNDTYYKFSTTFLTCSTKFSTIDSTSLLSRYL